ncbi:MAG: hypothetical protein P1U56_20540 [Saprospiraceae bacterium]|nr:hypothetical protein [Saprospiraceae bacterium]
MITKTIALLLSLSLTTLYDTTTAPMTISVDIEFCSAFQEFENSICHIQEAEFDSRDRLLVDQKGNFQGIIIDRRSITTEKAEAFFGTGQIVIKHRNVINLPYLQKSILIRPGEYSVEQLKRGYKIQLQQ